MHITKAVIKNYRTIKDATIEFNPERNIIVGPNETGKSTLLEAINLALSGQINGRSILFDIHPFLFNVDCVTNFIADLTNNKDPEPPFFKIELFLNDEDVLADLKGTNNSLRENVPGLLLLAELNPEFANEYNSFIAEPNEITSLPIEYYQVIWRTFAGKNLNPRSKPLKSTMIDTEESRYGAGPNKYIIERIVERLEPADRAKMSLSYRKMKEAFIANDNVKSINDNLKEQKGIISKKTLSVDLDVTSKGSWESGIVTKLDNIPFDLIGKGEQSSVKIHLALDAAANCQILLIEEPENHLSFTNLNQLIKSINEKSVGKQLFITTHSNFVLNKLDIGNVLLFRNDKTISLDNLTEPTRDYFLKLPGHDTLRLVLSNNKTILVEGPSDELIVQRAYWQKHKRLPIDDGIDVITVRALAFKRFLEISDLLQIETHVITDNDGDIDALKKKYKDFDGKAKIHIHYDDDVTSKTLEPQLIKSNGLVALNKIFKTQFKNEAELLQYMSDNKTECALMIFNSEDDFIVPSYISNAFA